MSHDERHEAALRPTAIPTIRDRLDTFKAAEGATIRAILRGDTGAHVLGCGPTEHSVDRPVAHRVARHRVLVETEYRGRVLVRIVMQGATILGEYQRTKPRLYTWTRSDGTTGLAYSAKDAQQIIQKGYV